MNKIKKLIAAVLALSLSASVACFSVAAEEGELTADDYVAISGGTWDFDNITEIPSGITTENTGTGTVTDLVHSETVTGGSLKLKSYSPSNKATYGVYWEGAIFTAPTPTNADATVKCEIDTSYAYATHSTKVVVTMSDDTAYTFGWPTWTASWCNNNAYNVDYTVTFNPAEGVLAFDAVGTSSNGTALAGRTTSATKTGVTGTAIKNVYIGYTYYNNPNTTLSINDVSFKEAKLSTASMEDTVPGTKLNWYKRYDANQTEVSADYGVIMERTQAGNGRISAPVAANRRTPGTATAGDIAYENAAGVVLENIDETYKPVIAAENGAAYNMGTVAATSETEFKVNKAPRTVGANEYLDIDMHLPSTEENDVVWFLVDKDATSTNLNTLLSNSQIIDAGYAKLSASQGKLSVTADMTGKLPGIYKLFVGSKNVVTNLVNINEIDYLPESAINLLWTTFKGSTEATLAGNLEAVTTRPAALSGVELSAEPYKSNGAEIRAIFFPMIKNCSNFNDARDAFKLACKIYTLNTKTNNATELIKYLEAESTSFLCDFSGDYANEVYGIYNKNDAYYKYFMESYADSTKSTVQEIKDAHVYSLAMNTINIANELGLYSAFEGLFDKYYASYGCDITSSVYAQYSSILWRALAGQDLSTKANIQAIYNTWNPEEEEGNVLLDDLVSEREQDYNKTATGAQALIIALNNWKNENATPVSTKEFSDIDNVSWAEDAILTLYKLEIINGTGNGKFSPNANITREQVVKMIVSAFNIEQNTEAPEFIDVDADAWYAPYIYAAYSADIVKGYDEAQFGVGTNMTRADIAVVLYRYMLSKGATVEGVAKQFNDEALIPDYAKDAIDALSGAGVINGTDEGNFEPTKSATRAEFAVMLNSMLNLM